LTILILELMAALSFVYAFFLLFIAFAPVPQVLLLFLWQLAAGLIFYWLAGKHKIGQLAALLLLLPLFCFSGILAACFILAAAAYCCIYIRTTLLRSNAEQSAKNFKRTLFIFISALVFRYTWPFMLPSGSLVQAAPFWIIYFLASVFFVRSIRHLESGLEPEKIRRANLRYLAGISVLSVLTALSGVREFINRALHQLLYWLAYGFVYLGQLILWVYQALPRSFTNLLESWDSRNGQASPAPEGLESVGQAVEEQMAAWDMAALDLIVPFILAALVIYILYRIIFTAGNRSFVGRDYVEVREYIKAAKPKKPRRRRERSASRSGQQIRLLYRRFLQKLSRQQVELQGTDTSLDVKLKADSVFSGDTRGIRELYTRSRYGNKPADPKAVAAMEAKNTELNPKET
jgi:hypothetical protein